MRHLPFKSRILTSVSLSLFGAVLLHGAVRAAELSVCIDSSSASAARDQALAETVAKHENATLAVHHFDGDGDDEGFTAKEFRALLASQCDLVLGYPLDLTDGAPPPGLMVTAPYDQTGFSLVTANPLPSDTLSGLPDGTEVAVTYGTVPNLYFVTHHNIQSDIHLSEADTLKALVDGKVKAAMLWQPTMVQYLTGHANSRFTMHALQEPHARWNIVALYGPKGAQEAAAFQADAKEAVAAPKKSGRLDTRYGLRMPGRFARHNPLIQLAADVTGGTEAGGTGAPPAIYTGAQAKTGEDKYNDNCAQCHGPNLQGMSGPALKGPLFASVKQGFSVGDILTFMSINMPATQPGSLSHDDYVQIMAYVLAQNGYPAGPTELTFDGGTQSKVPLLYHGK